MELKGVFWLWHKYKAGEACGEPAESIDREVMNKRLKPIKRSFRE